MAEVIAKLDKLRISPRKARLVVNVVKNMDAVKAQDQLRFLNKRVAKDILKLLDSAIANAEHNFRFKKENLVIKKITVNEGFKLHRWMPRAHGRATPIIKRSSIVTLVLAEKVPSKSADKSKKSEVKKAEGLKIVKQEEIKHLAKDKDEKKSDQKEQKEKFTGSKFSKFKEKIFTRKAGE